MKISTTISILVRLVLVAGLWLAPHSAHAKADASYPRAGWVAKLSTLAHGVSGTAEIVDERTIVLRNFNYDGGGPRVYAYLGTSNTTSAFDGGLTTAPLLNRPGNPYANATITITLPTTATLDGYTAISIWCADFRINFGSGAFRQQTFVPAVIR